MKIIFTSKGKKEGYDTEEVMNVFENSDDLDEIKRTVENAKDRISVTWASVECKDNAGELIPIEDIVKEQDTLLERHGPRTDEHTNRVIGETIAYKVMEHPETKSLGVLHLDKTFAHNEFDDKIWNEIQSGERKGDSVGGFNTGESRGIDEVTGEKAKVLEGFKQFETASVKDPCNPLALTEAYSVVAKSNKSQIKKPAELDRCVQHLMNDPDFKPKEGRTKEESAFAVCQTQLNKKSEVEKFWKNVEKKKYINESNLKKNIIKEGDNMKIKKAISQFEKILEKLKEDTPEEEEKEEEEEAKQDEEKVPEEKKKTKQEDEEKPEEEKKKTKQEDEEKPEEEEKKKKKKQEEDKPEEEVEKEEAAGDIAGEEPAKDQPEPPEPEDPNDADVFKRVKNLEKKFDKMKDNFVNKVSTPRPSGPKNFVNKADEISKLAMDLATGKTRKTWNQVHKHVDDWMNEEVI